jgi:sialate O-acetylesterase
MRSNLRVRFLLSGVLLLLLGVSAAAAELLPAGPALPLLSPIFRDAMVLQRGKANSFWGWTAPGKSVRVTIGDQSAEGIADADGKWQLQVAVPPAGGPYRVTVEGQDKIVLENVLVGDVWLCGGQSNMLFALSETQDAETEAKAANHPNIRFYKVASRVAYTPVGRPKGAWKVCTPETAGDVSAVAYYFARRLEEQLGVPIGLVQAAVGGSPAESWISAETLATTGEFVPQIAEIERLRASGAPEQGSFLMHWLDEYDRGGKNAAWAQPEFDDRGWKSVPIPGGFAELGVPTEPSVCWFRRDVTLPDPLPSGSAKVYLGEVYKMESTYVNGQQIGASSWSENPRIYTVPAGVLKPGRNVIAVRVFKNKPVGGFRSPAETLRLALGDGTAVPLAGEWRGAVSVDAKPPHPLPLDLENYPTMPEVLYNGMIAPLAPLSITGALWYQGEANSSDAVQYRKLMPALIADWRTRFGQGEFPFYLVSLPAFMERKAKPGTDGWAEIREVQARTAHCVRNTGVAVTIDTGEADNIHPRNKRPVGERLAALALANHYGRDLEASGPTLRAVERRGAELALHFDHARGGLRIHGEMAGEFAIAGEDRQWHWAQARIEAGNVVVVSAPEVPQPVAARYAWQANPVATLFNADGWPATPFRTDDWPLKPVPLTGGIHR